MSAFFKAMLEGFANVTVTAATVTANQQAAKKAKKTAAKTGSKCTPCEAERRIQASTARVNHLNGISK